MREIQYEDRNDKQIVLAAVRQKGLAIQYAHPDLMSDKDVVMAAVKEDGYVYEYANDLSADKDFLSIILLKIKAYRYDRGFLCIQPKCQGI